MDLREFVSLSDIPTGRRIFAHRKVLERADPLTMRDLIAHVKKAIAHDLQTLQVELSRRGAPQARFGLEAVRLDGLLDRSVTGLDGFFDSFIRICGPDNEIGAAATELRNTVFPTGVRDITSLPYIQEDAAVDAILTRLAEPHMQALLAKLPGTDTLIALITARHAEYHAELRKDEDRPSQEEMREMQHRGHQYLKGTVILILGHHVRTEDEVTTNHLLEPIRQQVLDVREARQRRRPVLDVNPDTGEPELRGNDQDPSDPDAAE
jgi:hypothetical protein